MEEPQVLLLKRIRVLVVEDDKKTRRLYYLGIKNNMIFKRRSCTDGKEALAIYGHWKPDIIILDIMMPDMTGYELLKHIREHWGDRDTTIIMATAMSDVNTITDCLKLGIQGYIVKPFDYKEIAGKIIEYFQAADPIRANLAHQYLDNQESTSEPASGST
ncbi:MAG: response regulator [Nitrospirae bacterium]|nr:response regulator [Nitrospirota bacterium]